MQTLLVIHYLIFSSSTGMTYWTPELNTDDPSDDGDDIEQIENIPYVCQEPLDILCTVADTGADYSTTGDVLNSDCTLEEGLNCTAAAQTSWVNVTYTFTDYRIVQTTVPVNTTSLECTVHVNATDLGECGGGVSGNVTGGGSVNGTNGGGLNGTSPGNNNATINGTSAGGSNGTSAGSSNGTNAGICGTQTAACINGNIMCVDASAVSGGNVTVCSNVTVETMTTINVNESFVNTGWYMNASSAPCHDYQVSFQCARGKMKSKFKK